MATITKTTTDIAIPTAAPVDTTLPVSIFSMHVCYIESFRLKYNISFEKKERKKRKKTKKVKHPI